MDPKKQVRIERRAYALWQAEGQPHGRHEEHWLRAMRELETEENGGKAAKRTPRRRKKQAS